MEKYNFISLDKKEAILEIIEGISDTLSKYILESKNEFRLFTKELTHSDLPTFAKATQPNKFDDNLLYYVNEDALVKSKEITKSAHQSNIGIASSFYKHLGVTPPREKQYKLNNYINVMLVNDTLTYFNSKYTKEIFDKLSKKYNKKKNYQTFSDLDIFIDKESNFTNIDISIAAHGLGIRSDSEFYKLRHHIFKSDSIYLIYEKCESKKGNLFIALEKNPTFFTVLGISNKIYEQYQNKLKEKKAAKALSTDASISFNEKNDEITRAQQDSWRKMLAKEVLSYSSSGKVFCPITYIECDFNNLGALFIASHIKAFNDPNTLDHEKYDINNGLLLSRTADALFDSHLITIDENKKLKYSFLLEMEGQLFKNALGINNNIFEPLLNKKRMKYLEYHREIFNKKEEERKKGK